MERPMQLTAFPEIAPNRPMGLVPPSVLRGSNATALAKLAPVYLEGHTVLDPTYGDGKWWTIYYPPGLIAHDLYKLDGVDFTHLPEADNSVDVVVFDPPYIPVGGAPIGEAAERHADAYGLVYRSRPTLLALLHGGLSEAARVARLRIIVKCMDYTSNSTFYLGHRDVLDMADKLDLPLVDLIVHDTGTGPGGHNITRVKRTRRSHSYFLVFGEEGGITEPTQWKRGNNP